MVKKNKKIIKLILTIIICVPFLVSAAPSTYNLLEPIAGGQTSVTSGGDIEKYIQSGYNYLLGLAVALSVLMLVIGGVEYTMTFASEGKKGEAKKRIEDAITGLLIALLSYAVLYTINPNLTRITVPGVDESCDATTANKSGGTGGGGAGWDLPAEATTVTGSVGGSGSGSAGGSGVGTTDKYQLQLGGDNPTSDRYMVP